jgi:hypothetical protein
MPALESLARFLYRKGKNPTSVADTRELAHDLIGEQAGGVDARQKAFAGLKFECKSAIDAEARKQNSGAFKGRRCIKPEPYGRIFSTSSAVRLVDPDTSLTVWPPLALNFTKVERGH